MPRYKRTPEERARRAKIAEFAREGEFEPQLVKKNQISLSADIVEKILSMYAKGMTTSHIEARIKEIYASLNTIESFNRQIRKVTKSKSVFNRRRADEDVIYGDDGYHSLVDGRRTDWNAIYAQLEIFFADRMPY